MNPMNFINIIKGIKNPRQQIMNMVKGNNNPIAKNLIEMAENNDIQGVENFARNFFKQQGQDFDEIVKLFKK